ncbi:MAG: hypothetical protein ABFR19_04065 [Pseudomonadota bacterium]
MTTYSGRSLTSLLTIFFLSFGAQLLQADEQPGIIEPDLQQQAVRFQQTQAESKHRENFWDYQEMDETAYNDYLSKGVEYTLDTTRRAANWLDSFFDNERVRDEENVTRLKISARGFYDQDEGSEADVKFSIRARMPHTRNQLQLFLSNDLDEDMDASSKSLPIPRDVDDSTYLGLRVFNVIGDRIPGNTSASAGINFKGGGLNYFIEPRYSYLHDFDKWSLYFLQKIRYSHVDNLETRTRADFDRVLSEKYFFRLNTELYWKEDNEDHDGIENTLRFYLSQKLPGPQALIYEFSNLFRSDPDYHLHASSLAVRYRRQVWRPWLFLEAAPQVAFREEEDFNPSLGITVKLEIMTF